MNSSDVREGHLLRVARPRECNTQQQGVECATTCATGTQQPTLKALALLALGRNNPRNNCATDTPKPAQQTLVAKAPSVARERSPDLVACVAFPRGATTQQTELPRRAVVKFRLIGGCPNSWCTALGAPGRSRETIIGEIVEKYGDKLIEVLP